MDRSEHLRFLTCGMTLMHLAASTLVFLVGVRTALHYEQSETRRVAHRSIVSAG